MSEQDPIYRKFRQVPVNRRLQFELLEVSSEKASVRMEIIPEYVQETGVVHGGLISALADTAAVYCFWPKLGKDRKMASIEFKVNFLRPAVFDSGPLEAHAKVIREGQTIGLCDVEVVQQGRMVAKGMFTYLFFDSPK